MYGIVAIRVSEKSALSTPHGLREEGKESPDSLLCCSSVCSTGGGERAIKRLIRSN